MVVLKQVFYLNFVLNRNGPNDDDDDDGYGRRFSRYEFSDEGFTLRLIFIFSRNDGRRFSRNGNGPWHGNGTGRISRNGNGRSNGLPAAVADERLRMLKPLQRSLHAMVVSIQL